MYTLYTPLRRGGVLVRYTILPGGVLRGVVHLRQGVLLRSLWVASVRGNDHTGFDRVLSLQMALKRAICTKFYRHIMSGQVSEIP